MTDFYDFNVAPNMNVIKTLEKFKFSGACVFYKTSQFDEDTHDEFDKMNDETSIDLYMGVVISTDNINMLHSQVTKFKKEVDFIMVNGGSPRINLATTKINAVDILNHPYSNKFNSGINQNIAQRLKNKNIKVNINLKDVISRYGLQKSKIINQINQVLKLQKKFEFDCILSSGSKSFYDVRSPQAMKLLSSMFEIDSSYARDLISKNPYSIIESKQTGSIIKGVKIL